MLAFFVVLSFSSCAINPENSTSQEVSSIQISVENSQSQEESSQSQEETSQEQSEDSSSQSAVEHQHSYAVEYSKDETHHWFACTGEDCESELEKEEHVWDNGEITTPPTATQTGEKTFTCTDCGQTRKENLIYVPNNQVNQSAWIESFDATRLNNVTMEGHIVNNKAETIPMKIWVENEKSYEFMQFSETNKYEAYYIDTGETFTNYYKYTWQNEWTINKDYSFGYNGDVFLSFLPLYDKYTEFVYNGETGCYEAGAMDCTSELFGTLKYESVVIKFEDGKLIRIEAKMRESFRTTAKGSDIMEYVFAFSKYSQTTVEIPVVES